MQKYKDISIPAQTGARDFFMIETLTNIETNFNQQRLLSDVNHLIAAMSEDGSLPQSVYNDIKTNKKTAVHEISMPSSVAVTEHQVEYRENNEGLNEGVIVWLGRTAVENASSQFYQSVAGQERGYVEIAEARRNERNLTAGVAQIFVSPKMTEYDAPAEIARTEHLYDEDSLRVSYAVTNSRGEIVSRRLESLLVHDVPLEAWVSMFSDQDNIFGKSFNIDNPNSALPIMELFDQLDLPEEAIPEGPVSLVEAVLPYVNDGLQHQSVARQLEAFRGDQMQYRQEAEKTAEEWVEFEVELARSLRDRVATYEIRRFIIGLQETWSQANLEIINSHSKSGGDYHMSEQFAAALEDSKRQALNSIAGLWTGNERMIRQVGNDKLNSILQGRRHLDLLRISGINQGDINMLQMELQVKVAKENISVGGGCPGTSANNFGGPSSEDDKSSSAEKDWKWKKGKCVVKACPSPNPTEVGPCSVCRKCQAEFNRGNDPTKPSIVRSIQSSVKLKKVTPKIAKAA